MTNDIIDAVEANVDEFLVVTKELLEDSDKRMVSFLNRDNNDCNGLNTLMRIVATYNIQLVNIYNHHSGVVQKLAQEKPFAFMLSGIPHTEMYDRLIRISSIVANQSIATDLYIRYAQEGIDSNSKLVIDIYNNIHSLGKWMKHYVETYRINKEHLDKLFKDS